MFMGTEVSSDYYKLSAECKVNMLRELGFSLEKDMRVLDFGCGEGNLIKAYLELGYDIYGADIMDNISLDAGRYKKIEFDPYRIPYDDNSFDLVYSTSVFEHVQNTEESFKEIYRVLKPGGVSIHSLPSRYRLLEPHLYIPLGGGNTI